MALVGLAATGERPSQISPRSRAPRRQPPQAASLSYTMDYRGRTGWRRLSQTRRGSQFNPARFANSMSSSARNARLNPTLAVCAQTISVRPCCPGSLAATATRRPRFGLPHALSNASVARVSHARVEGGLASRPSCPRTPAPGPPTPPGAALARRAASPPAIQPQAEPRAALRARGFRVRLFNAFSGARSGTQRHPAPHSQRHPKPRPPGPRPLAPIQRALSIASVVVIE